MIFGEWQGLHWWYINRVLVMAWCRHEMLSFDDFPVDIDVHWLDAKEWPWFRKMQVKIWWQSIHNKLVIGHVLYSDETNKTLRHYYIHRVRQAHKWCIAVHMWRIFVHGQIYPGGVPTLSLNETQLASSAILHEKHSQEPRRWLGDLIPLFTLLKQNINVGATMNSQGRMSKFAASE